MPPRRALLQASLSLAGLLGGLGLLPRSAQAAWQSAAFDARSLPDLARALGGSTPVAHAGVVLGAPDVAEDGNAVSLACSCALPGLRRLLLLVEKNPTLLAASFEPAAGLEPAVTTRVKMAQSSNVVAVALMADNRVLFARREVKVTVGGCGNEEPGQRPTRAPGSPEATRLRAQTTGDTTTVRLAMAHEMESGQRKDASGRTVPAWFIQEAVLSLNGKPVLTAQFGPSVSRNPYLQVALKTARPGDKLTLAWQDSRGERRSDDATVL